MEQETKQAEKLKEKPMSRLRESYRLHADRVNPNPAVQVLDSRGRPRPVSDHHKWLGQRKP
jgi:hypothetical protein